MSKILIIVGHGKSKTGGYDSGAVNGQYHEFMIAREIAKYAVQYYNENFNEQCDLMNYDGDLYLQDRINRLQDKTYDFVAEIHLNAGGGTGTEVYYYHNSENCKQYAVSISESISSTFNIKNRGAKVKLNDKGLDYFGIIRDTKPTSVLVETVFIDTDDLNKVIDENGQKACGSAIAEGIWKIRESKVNGEKNSSTPKPTPTPTPPVPIQKPAPKPVATPKYYSGKLLTLKSAKVYLSGDAKAYSVKISGVYYLYDGKNYNDRFRICKKKEHCGKKISYVIGYINKVDVR